MSQRRDSFSVANDPKEGDLTTRLLAEIERREEVSALQVTNGNPWARRELAYLDALREIAEMHYPDPDMPGWCVLCITADGYWPCGSAAAVAECLDVTP